MARSANPTSRQSHSLSANCYFHYWVGAWLRRALLLRSARQSLAPTQVRRHGSSPCAASPYRAGRLNHDLEDGVDIKTSAIIFNEKGTMVKIAEFTKKPDERMCGYITNAITVCDSPHTPTATLTPSTTVRPTRASPLRTQAPRPAKKVAPMMIHPYKLQNICTGLFDLVDICGEFM